MNIRYRINKTVNVYIRLGMFILVSKRNELSGGYVELVTLVDSIKINVPMAGKQGVQNGFEVLRERQ